MPPPIPAAWWAAILALHPPALQVSGLARAMMTTKEGAILVGDWRRRYGTKTDAHLYNATHNAPSHTQLFAEDRPICDKRIKRKDTVLVRHGVPCYTCLVLAITRRQAHV